MQLTPSGNTAPPKAPADVVKDGTDASFMADVIEASRQVPVLVDFWAPWCGPCKQLGPALEKVVRAAKGAVRLVKIDTDRNPAVAGQLRIQSIPAVFAFFQGRPVDGFVGALPESQLKTFVDRLVQLAGGAKPDDLQAVLAEAQALLDEGEVQGAAEVFNAVLAEEPENAVAYVGLARCLMAAGQEAEARDLIDQAPAPVAKSAEMQALKSQLDLAAQAKAAGPVGDLKARLAQAPDDHQTRYELAMAQYAQGEREEAVEALLEIVRRDREWNEQAARKQLLKFFEAFGPTDKLTVMARRKLSSILFA